MAGKPKFTDQHVADAIIESHGLITIAADRLGCSAATVYSYSHRSPLVRQAIEESRERVLDLAESSLFAAVAAGEERAVMFVLKTLGRNRGYVDRQEQVGLTDKQLDELIEAELAKREKAFRIAAESMTTEELQAIDRLAERAKLESGDG